MLFNVMDNQHGGSECNSCAGNSNLAIAYTGREPISIGAIQIQNKMVRSEGFLRESGFSTLILDVRAPINFHRFGGKQFQPLD